MDVWFVILTILTALACGGVIYQFLGARRDHHRFPPPGRLVQVNRHRLHLQILGGGEPVVVLESGIAASSISWQIVQSAVARFSTVFAYDRAGLGWSDSDSATKSLHRAVDELRTALARASLPAPYVLVGHSFGAYLVRLFVARHPEEVAGLVLVDPLEPGEWVRPIAEERRRLRGAVLFSRIGAAVAALGIVRLAIGQFVRGDRTTPRAVLGSFGREATRVVERLVGQVGKLPPESWPAVQAHWTRPGSFWAMSQYLAALPSCAREVIQAEATDRPTHPRSSRGDKPWSMPTIVLSAATASPTERNRHRITASRSPLGQHRSVASGGHWVQLDASRDVVESIEEVVRAVR